METGIERPAWRVAGVGPSQPVTPAGRDRNDKGRGEGKPRRAPPREEPQNPNADEATPVDGNPSPDGDTHQLDIVV